MKMTVRGTHHRLPAESEPVVAQFCRALMPSPAQPAAALIIRVSFELITDGRLARVVVYFGADAGLLLM